MSQTKRSNYTFNKCFPKMVSVDLGSSHHADVHFSDQLGFSLVI